MSTEIQFRREVQRLEPGRAVEAELKGGEGHRYEIDLAAGQTVHLVAAQRGIDVVLRLRAPDGSLVAEVDSPTGDQGAEQLFEIPDTPGRFRVEIVSLEPSALRGRYEIELDAPRPASDADRRHVGAFRLFQEGEALRRQGVTKGRQALAKYEAALGVWRELSNREWEAESLYRIGWVRQNSGEMHEALAALREALPLLQALGKRDEEGMALTRSGMIELRDGHTQEAIELHHKAVAIFREIGKPGLEASALNNLGAAYDVAGEAQKGLDAYRLGLARARTAGDRPEEEASALRGIGEILINQGKLESAMDGLRQALEAFRKQGSSDGAAYALSRMAAISQRLGRLNDALAQLQEALALRLQSEDKDGEIVTLNSLGTVHLLRKETAKAGEVYAEALSLAQSSGNRFGEAVSLLNLGRYRFDTGDLREALRLHEEAAAQFQALGFRRGEVSTRYGCARALHALGDYAAARQHLEHVVAGVEALRAESENQDLRSAYFATKQHYFELQIDILMHLHEQDPAAGYDARALTLNERRRARSLLEILAESKAEIQRDADPELLARERDIQRRVRASEERLQRARGAGRDADIAAIEERQRALLVELADVEARLRSRDSQPSALTRPLEVPAMRKLLGPWSLLLVYSLGEERSFLWSLASDGKLASYSLPSRELLEELARQVRAAWGRRGDRRATAQWGARLSRELLGPVADQLGTKRLLIVADGALEALPFAALPDPRVVSENPAAGETADPLLVRNEVVHLPSLSTLAALRRESLRRAVPPSWLGIVGDPVFTPDDPRINGGASAAEGLPHGASAADLARSAEDLGIERFERLPFTRVEAASIARFVPESERRMALDFQASRELVESQELRRYRILHFATHGLLNSRHPELSGLVLSLVDPQGNPRADGFLLAHEISRLDLPAQLVVLSACQTGLGAELRGEGLVSLTRSFMQAGTPRVVVSLWNINDRATAELMTRFYRALIEKGLPPASALRCAQLSLRRQKEWRSPFFWASFIFQGEWRIQDDSGEPPIEKQAVPSQPPPVPDVDFPPPGSHGAPACPELD